jgi:hypothetical protein
MHRSNLTGLQLIGANLSQFCRTPPHKKIKPSHRLPINWTVPRDNHQLNHQLNHQISINSYQVEKSNFSLLIVPKANFIVTVFFSVTNHIFVSTAGLCFNMCFPDFSGRGSARTYF